MEGKVIGIYKVLNKTNYITVNNITKSGREWAIVLNHGVNYINTMIRNKGLEETIKYIEDNYN